MKILWATILFLCLSFSAFADQQTTVLTEKTSIGSAAVTLPYIDGSMESVLEKQANGLIKDTAAKLLKEIGNQGHLSYEVVLNRPSLVSLLLIAENDNRKAYSGLNIDLTTGKEFSVTDYFIDDDKVKGLLGDYENVLFSEKGFMIRKEKNAAYSSFVSYEQVIDSMRIGEAGRLMQIAKLTQNASGKILKLENCGLIALKLDSNPSTGYGWEMNCNSPAVVKVGSSFTIPSGKDSMTGVQGTEIIVLAVTKPGTYDIRMDYKRAWEKMRLHSFNFTVIVE